MSRPTITYACLGFLGVAALFYGCQSPEAFLLSDDAGFPTTGSGGDMTGSGGMMLSSGGMIGSGGMLSSGGRTGSGGAAGSGGAMGGRGGATSGSGGAMGGRGGGSAGSMGSGGSASGGTGMGGRGVTTGSGGAGGRGTGTGGAGGGIAQAKILSIDFGVGGMGAPAMPATDMAGVKPAARWNSAVGPMGSLAAGMLVFSDASAATGASVMWNAPAAPSPNTGVYAVGLTDTSGDSHMLNGYLDPGMGTAPAATITVSGLPAPLATGRYDVYVYYMAQLTSGVTRKHKMTIGATTINVSQTGPSATTFMRHTQTADMGTTGDYVLFTNVTGASFTLTSTAVSASDNNLRAPVNGIQIVYPSGS